MEVGKKLFVVFVSLVALSGCGVQSIPQAKNDVDASNAEVINQYKRRADLIPNLVKIVGQYAKHERETLQSVTEARARATSVQVNPGDAKSMEEFSKAQGALSQSLGRLLMVAENYPNLKANQNFAELQVELARTENRVTVARNRAITSVKNFNNLVTVFPTSITNKLMFHYQPLPQFGADADVKSLETPPSIDFQ